MTIRDSRDQIRVLLYSYYTTITGWGVLLMDNHAPMLEDDYSCVASRNTSSNCQDTKKAAIMKMIIMICFCCCIYDLYHSYHAFCCFSSSCCYPCLPLSVGFCKIQVLRCISQSKQTARAPAILNPAKIFFWASETPTNLFCTAQGLQTGLKAPQSLDTPRVQVPNVYILAQTLY